MNKCIVGHYTVAQLARMMHRSRGSIKSLISSGRLQAYDANPDGENRQWRVTPDAFSDFIQGAAAKPAKATHRRQRATTSQIKEFF